MADRHSMVAACTRPSPRPKNPSRSSYLVAWTLVGLGLVSAVGCSKEEKPGAGKDPEKRGAPPPPPPPKGACDSGGGVVSDAEAAAFFPKKVEEFCLDPNGGDKAFGESAKLPLDQICDLFDGECDIYKRFDVKRVVQLRYVDGKGTPATIDIYLSKFSSAENAYAMFTKRVVGDSDPALDSTPKPTPGGGAAALGEGNAYVWRGPYLVEITYNDETAARPKFEADGKRLLPPLAKEIGEKLTGDLGLPPVAALLPADKRIAMGTRLVTKDILGVSGAGVGAFGYYADGDKRYRFVTLTRADKEQAGDVLALFAKVEGATREKDIGDGAVRWTAKEGDAPAGEWIVARRGGVLIGIGDEARVLRAGMTPEEHGKATLTKDEKVALLKKAIEGLPK